MSSMTPAQIISFEEFDVLRPTLGKIVCTSGPFDPMHPGHASCLAESKHHGDTLVVIVNGDNFLRTKKGKAFMDLKTRAHLVSYIRGVDYVIPFEIENDQSVCVALEKVRPHIFTKGGDRDITNILEREICEKYNIQVISGIGHKKLWSSSDFLREWGEYWKTK
jgi:cytidyltransferase-like protein